MTQVKQFDPFEKVLLTKGIDNQILTSFRTLNKSNNMISNTLKVVHQRFLPNAVGNAKKGYKNRYLYQLNKDIFDPLQDRTLLHDASHMMFSVNGGDMQTLDEMKYKV